MKINWSLIAQTYPKSYNQLIGETAATQRLIASAVTKTPHVYTSNNKYFHERDLYDFFDEQNLFVSIVPTPNGFTYMIFDGVGTVLLDKANNDVNTLEESEEEIVEPVKKKGGKFKKHVTPVSGGGVYHESRRDAEGFAFEDAFSVLEDK